MSGVPLRILFLFRPGTLTRFALLVPSLAEKGHQVHIAFLNAPASAARNLAESFSERYPNITYGVAPRRGDIDGWGPVTWVVRGLMDLARYSHPRYADAARLRRRMRKRIVGRLRRPGEIEPVGRRLALRLALRVGTTEHPELSRRVIRTAALLEDAIPTSRRVNAYLRERAPDVVLTTGTLEESSLEVDFVKSARRLGIPSGVCVPSWDNLTNKGLLKCRPERVFVWNETQVREVEELHGVPAERVRPTGAHAFDEWFARRPSGTHEEFTRRVGFEPGLPYVVYVSSSPDITRRREPPFVTRWIEALRSSGDERIRRLGIVMRPYPKFFHDWRGFDPRRFENVVLWPAREVFPIGPESRGEFYETLAHSAAVVGANTTAMIEAAIVGKNVLSVLVPEFAQKETLHFPYLQAENGGFLHVAASLDEHIEQLGRVLDDDAADAERRRRFVESFVRPAGIDRPAAPILTDAIEELAGLKVDAATRANVALRSVLALEAGLNSLYALSRRLPRPTREADRRVSAKTQRAPA
jgi:hypothetical protein